MKPNYFILSLTITLLCMGCEKFLAEKSDKSLVLADKLENLQALLDHSLLNNQNFEGAGEGSSDDYYLTAATLQSLREDYRNQYTWQPAEVFPRIAVSGNGWRYTYDANVIVATVLEGLESIPRNSGRAAEWDAIKGQALANRAYRYLNAVSVWAMAYDPQTAKTDLGLPLRLNSDITAPTLRATVEETFQQIINDVQAAIPLLPVVNINAYRANKSFAYGILARTYWYMTQYDQALIYADSCLQLHNSLMDFSTLNAAATYPIANTNPEMIRYATYTNWPHINSAQAKVSPALYDLYADGDLRKTVFFAQNTDGTFRFKGNYNGTAALFAGISTNEMLLIQAECQARAGDLPASMAAVNRLLQHRIRAEDFTPIQANTAQEALTLILTERRRELPFRGLRWMDVKRLNREGANITLTREIDGHVYTLPPNDSRYALAIPEDIIEMTGIPQNPR